MKKKLNTILSESLRKNWNLNAFSDYEGETYTYSKLAKHISTYHEFFANNNIQPGDKIVLLGRNSAHWAISYLTIISYGAVVVPVLPDFKSDDLHYIINHSEAILVFVSDNLASQLDGTLIKKVRGIISLDNFDVKWERRGKKLANSISDLRTKAAETNLLQKDLKLQNFSNNDLAILSYTSGTTGFSKGVMINRNSLVSNIVYAQDHMPLKAEDRICSFLPMAHIYGQLFEFLFPFSVGCHTTFIDRMPSPQVVVKAFNQVKPRLILSVPLVIEKVFKKRIAPALEKRSIKTMLKIPLLNKLVHNKVRKQLSESFGGNFFEIVIGGAALNKEIEDFLRKIKFRFTIGYGMTECGPLISYDPWNTSKPYSAGKIVDRMEVKIDSADPYKTVGEILVRGENVMMGYYKDDKSTNTALDKDNWLHTGDLGVIDNENYIYIRGRSKNMILGANGKNIYPEEIEAKINHLPLIIESLVVQQNEHVVALVYPDQDVLKAESISGEELTIKMEELRKLLNASLPKYMQVQKFILQREEFDKTPKKSIKRYKYQ